MKREFLMLAKKYDLAKLQQGDWLWSVKLDGMRAFWDGGITRGKAVTWTERKATGLWTRYMNPINAPDWWLDTLPSQPLDGELWLGPGRFQELISITKSYVPDERWRNVKYEVFDTPTLDKVFEIGLINNPNCHVHLTMEDIRPMQQTAANMCIPWGHVFRFIDSYKYLEGIHAYTTNPVWEVLPQHIANDLNRIVEVEFPKLLDQGHEGIIFRKANSFWDNSRSPNLMKMKPYADSEAIVRGIVPGKGKHEGRMGALVVWWPMKDVEFNIGTGFTDIDREQAELLFPAGSMVSFKYRELSDDNVPKEARYWRKGS